MAQRIQSDSKIDRLQPPQSLDAERQVIGAVLKDAEAIHRVIEVIDKDTHFYSPKHRIIFRAILDLYHRNEPCDITTVSNELLRQNKLDTIGGRVYLVDLVEDIVSIGHIEAHAQIVLEKSVVRKLIDVANDISQKCYDGSQPVDDLLDGAEAEIFTISESRMKQGFVSIEATVNDVYRQIENPDLATKSVSTGFADIDRMTDGLRNGDFVVVAGRPSMGKTSLALNFAEHIALSKKKGSASFLSRCLGINWSRACCVGARRSISKN